MVLGLIGLVVGACVMYGWLRWRSRVQTAAVGASVTSLASAFTDVETELRAKDREIEIARRRADEYFTKIEECVTEANEARRLYTQSAVEAGAAQAMMLREIESLARQYHGLAVEYRRAVGKDPPRPEPRRDPTILAVANEFQEAHIVPHTPAPAPAA